MRKYTLIIIGLVILNTLIVGVKVTYSSFYSKASLESSNLAFAKINFNNEKSTKVSFSLGDFKPGLEKDYEFKVSNYKNGSGSDVDIGYRLTILTYHFIPTTMKLYKKDSKEEIGSLVLTCDKTTKRDSENKLSCVSDVYTLDYKLQDEDSYLLKIIYNEKDNNQEAWDESYSEAVDFVDIKIDSWQLTEDK